MDISAPLTFSPSKANILQMMTLTLSYPSFYKSASDK